MDNSPPLAPFGRWRSILWPVYAHELKKLLPMLVIFFLISFNYNLLRTTKDALIITAPEAGAKVIPFIKFCVMMPTALLLTYIFTRISQVLSREKTFYVMNAIFLSYFALFIFVLYPNREQLQPNGLCEQMSQLLPKGYLGMVAMVRYWVYTTFYVMSELWGTAIMLVAFWGFANEVTRIDEAKRFYCLFGTGANLSGAFAGQAGILLSDLHYNASLPFGKNAWDQSVLYIVGTVLLTSLLCLLIFRWINCYVFNDHSYARVHESKIGVAVQEKRRSSFRKDLAYVAHSPYLLAVAVIVFSYGFVISSSEVLWKNQVHQLHPQTQEYQIYMNSVMIWISVLATFSGFFVTGNLIRRAGWMVSAMVSPGILLITSLGFFGSMLFPRLALWMGHFAGCTPLAITVFFGTMQNCLSRASKYTFFDTTKEMAYIPLDRHIKLKGKAAIDGIVSRLGKSGASVLFTLLLTQLGSLAECAPVVATCLFVVIGFWIAAVLRVGREFENLAAAPEPLSSSQRPATDVSDSTSSSTGSSSRNL